MKARMGTPTWQKELDRIFVDVDRVLERTARRLAKAAAPERGGVPVGGRFAGDPPGRGELPGTPIADAPSRPKVPTPDAAEGRPPSGSPTADATMQTYLIAAAAVQLTARTFRSAPDLREMLRAEVNRLMRAGEYEFIDALEAAKRQLVADIKGGLR